MFSRRNISSSVRNLRTRRTLRTHPAADEAARAAFRSPTRSGRRNGAPISSTILSHDNSTSAPSSHPPPSPVAPELPSPDGFLKYAGKHLGKDAMIEVGDSIEVAAETVSSSVTKASLQIGTSLETLSSTFVTGFNETAGKVGTGAAEVFVGSVKRDGVSWLENVVMPWLRNIVILGMVLATVVALICIGFFSGNVYGAWMAIVLSLVLIAAILSLGYDILVWFRSEKEKNATTIKRGSD